MKKEKDKSTKYLKKLAKRLDKKTLIAFKYGSTFGSVKELIVYAIGGKNYGVPGSYTITKRGKREQDVGNSRSLQDLYRITKHYFPDATIFDVRDTLNEINKSGHLESWFCETFRMIMFRIRECMVYRQEIKHYGIY